MCVYNYGWSKDDGELLIASGQECDDGDMLYSFLRI